MSRSVKAGPLCARCGFAEDTAIHLGPHGKPLPFSNSEYHEFIPRDETNTQQQLVTVALSEREWEAVLEAIDDSLAGCLQPGVCKRCKRLKRAVAEIEEQRK